MTNLVIEIIIIVATVFLFIKTTPKEGQPSRIPDKWGLPTIVSIGLLCLEVLGIILVARGMYPPTAK